MFIRKLLNLFYLSTGFIIIPLSIHILVGRSSSGPAEVPMGMAAGTSEIFILLIGMVFLPIVLFCELALNRYFRDSFSQKKIPSLLYIPLGFSYVSCVMGFPLSVESPIFITLIFFNPIFIRVALLRYQETHSDLS